MKNFLTLMTGVALLAATPALAQDAAPAVEAQAGMKVFGPNGGDVGIVDSVNGDVVIVATGKNMGALPISAFAKVENGLSVTITRADLDAAVEKAEADAKAALLASLTPGTQVKTVTGAAVIGTIQESDADYVTVNHAGQPVKLPVAAFMAQADGVSITMTEDQFKAALAGTQ